MIAGEMPQMMKPNMYAHAKVKSRAVHAIMATMVASTTTPENINTLTHQRIKGGGVADALFLRNSTHCRPKGSPLCTILRYPFLVTDPKIFLKTPSVPRYTNFPEVARGEKNAIFW